MILTHHWSPYLRVMIGDSNMAVDQNCSTMEKSATYLTNRGWGCMRMPGAANNEIAKENMIDAQVIPNTNIEMSYPSELIPSRHRSTVQYCKRGNPIDSMITTTLYANEPKKQIVATAP